MTAVLDIKEQDLPEFDLESQYETNPRLKSGVFRRYHVMNNPVNFIDPSGLCSQQNGLIHISRPNDSHFMREIQYDKNLRRLLGQELTILLGVASFALTGEAVMSWAIKHGDDILKIYLGYKKLRDSQIIGDGTGMPSSLDVPVYLFYEAPNQISNQMKLQPCPKDDNRVVYGCHPDK